MGEHNDSERTMLYCGSFFVVVICHPVDVSFVGNKKHILKEKMKWFSEGGEVGV